VRSPLQDAPGHDAAAEDFEATVIISEKKRSVYDVTHIFKDRTATPEVER